MSLLDALLMEAAPLKAATGEAVNVLAPLSGSTDDERMTGIILTSAPKALVQGNILSVPFAHPIQEGWSTGRFAVNQNHVGTPVPPWEFEAQRTMDSLESSIEDSLTAGFL